MKCYYSSDMYLKKKMKYQFKTQTRQLLGDLHTPVSLYLKLRDLYPESVLLESSDYHGDEDSLSYLALCP